MWCWPDGTQSQPKVSSPFGPREVTIPGASSMHMGTDFIGFSTVRCIGPGRVQTVYRWDGKPPSATKTPTGNSVVVDHGGGVTSQSMHLARLDVGVGQLVEAATSQGPMGATGLAGGKHLHFEIRVNGVRVDPVLFLAARIGGHGAGGESEPFPQPQELLEDEMQVLKLVDAGGFRFAVTNGVRWQESQLNDGAVGARWEAAFGPARRVDGAQWSEAKYIVTLFAKVTDEHTASASNGTPGVIDYAALAKAVNDDAARRMAS